MSAATKDALLIELRYAERLCDRTARLYRRVYTVGTFATVVAGSAALSALSSQVPQSVSIVGAMAFAGFGALMLAMRPTEKALANEADATRYAQLRTAAADMDAAELAQALDRARQTDTAEIEPLRDVAYNDVACEVGSAYAAVPLSWQQRVLAALA